VNFFQETIHKNTLALYAVYFEQIQKNWNETTLDPVQYPIVSKLRARSTEQIRLETDMKRFLLVSSIPPEKIETGSIWEFLLLKFEENEDLEATRKNIMSLPNNNSLPLYERTKIDIENLLKNKAKLQAPDPERLVADLICQIDFPFNDFLHFSELKSQDIIAQLLDFINKVEREYESLKSKCLQKNISETELQNLASGKDADKKKIIEEPPFLALSLFWSGDLRTKSKKLHELLNVRRPVSRPSVQIPQHPTVPTSNPNVQSRVPPENPTVLPPRNPVPVKTTNPNSRPPVRNTFLGISYPVWLLGILGLGATALFWWIRRRH